MSDTTHLLLPRAAPPLRLDSTAIKKRSLEMSPSRSSVRSSSSQSQSHTPSSSVPSTPLLPTRPPSPGKIPPQPADPNSFLTALAAQERRVLELREELHKADEDLENLKKQWAVHEAMKKKNELRQFQQLQPLNTPSLWPSMPSDEDSARANRAPDRQRIIPSSIQPSQRKVFAGSKHTRALSLLSPRDPRSHSSLLLRSDGPSKHHQAAANDVVAPATVPEIPSLDVDSSSADSYRGPQKDVILETGKQLVGDFRQGLWTFLEDFKQLTVGDEGISTTGLSKHTVTAPGNLPGRQTINEKRTTLKESPARKTGAVEVVRGAARKPQIEVSGSRQIVGSSLDRLTEAGGPSAISTAINSEEGNNANSSDSDDDEWDDWDNPKGFIPRRKDLVDQTDPIASPMTDGSSPRTSMRSVNSAFVSYRRSKLRSFESSLDTTPRPKNNRTSFQDRDDIPWPALTKLTPGSLKRTASSLMSEWERSLAPSIHNEAKALANLASADKKD